MCFHSSVWSHRTTTTTNSISSSRLSTIWMKRRGQSNSIKNSLLNLYAWEFWIFDETSVIVGEQQNASGDTTRTCSCVCHCYCMAPCLPWHRIYTEYGRINARKSFSICIIVTIFAATHQPPAVEKERNANEKKKERIQPNIVCRHRRFGGEKKWHRINIRNML